MVLSDLIAAFRQRTNDAVLPYLWDDTSITGFLNEAVTEACIRARLVFDTDSPFLSIPLVANQGEYAIDPSILQNGIVDVYVDGYAGTSSPGFKLHGTDQSVLDRDCWFKYRSQTGQPRYFMQDGSTLRLAPIPTDTGTMRLAVYRMPTDNEVMDTSQDSPIIQSQWHLRLLDWALYLAYSNNDSDTNNTQRAALAEARFESSFGKRVDANTERKRSERRSNFSHVDWPASKSRYNYSSQRSRGGYPG